jgi:hypothetical protein
MLVVNKAKDREDQISSRNGHSANIIQSNKVQKRLRTLDETFIIIFGGINEDGARFNDIKIMTVP